MSSPEAESKLCSPQHVAPSLGQIHQAMMWEGWQTRTITRPVYTDCFLGRKVSGTLSSQYLWAPAPSVLAPETETLGTPSYGSTHARKRQRFQKVSGRSHALSEDRHGVSKGGEASSSLGRRQEGWYVPAENWLWKPDKTLDSNQAITDNVINLVKQSRPTRTQPTCC